MSAADNPKASIIICTVDRPQQLAACVAALLQQQGAFEIIVIDQSTLPTITFDDKRIIHLRSSRKGLSHARNVGYRHARGDIVSFVDDDAVPDQVFVTELLRIFKQSDIDAVAGRILVQGVDKPYSRTQSPESRFLRMRDWGCVLGGNLAFKRSVAEDVGLFDESFGAGTKWASAEETDLFFRMIYKGQKVYYASSLVVFHPLEAFGHSDASLACKLFNYGKGMGALFAKHCLIFHNYIAVLFFLLSLLKPTVRMVQFLLTGKPVKFKLYMNIMLGRVIGFKEFYMSK